MAPTGADFIKCAGGESGADGPFVDIRRSAEYAEKSLLPSGAAQFRRQPSPGAVAAHARAPRRLPRLPMPMSNPRPARTATPRRCLFRLALAACASAAALAPSCARAGTIVRFETVMGAFDVQLYDAAMPRTVQNFLHYVTSNKYDGTVVHRNSDVQDPALRDFVIQGGGFTLHDPVPPATSISYSQVDTIAPIADEPGGGVTGLSNLRGTIAMAKSGPNTVTSQWFINQGDNSFLDSPARSDGGFSAFGSVLGNGMSVVDAIGDLPIPTNFGFSIGSPFGELPLRNFTGNSIQQIRVVNTVTVNDVRVLNLAPGDFDRNGIVNTADLNILKTNFGMTSGALFDKGDADMDGDVDGADFAMWQRSEGASTTPVSAVPEPSAAALALCGALALRRRRRR
jgi:cyclophilin family peptidyl-prolyl cis-trans isomerase